MNIPPINSKGLFTFSEPFNTLIPNKQEYKVVSVRNLDELVASGEKPFETVYVSVGLTETDFIEDVDKEVPVVVFSTGGKELFYVPADRILSQPNKTGRSYVERVMMVPLGALPLDIDLSVATSIVTDTIRDTIGIDITPELVTTSAVVQYTEEEHIAHKALLDNSKTVRESFRTKYFKLLTKFDKRGELISKFELMFKNNVCNK